MSDKYLLFSLDDDKAKKLGEVISNPTCKKIVNLLAEKSLSETEISKELGIPVNTVEYNLTKLLGSGIIEKTKKHFWSVKGKRIETYQVANKLIVISPKRSIGSKLAGIVPVILASGIFAIFVKYFFASSATSGTASLQDYAKEGVYYASESVSASNAPLESFVPQITSNVSNFFTMNETWILFLAGAAIASIVFLAFNWKRL